MAVPVPRIRSALVDLRPHLAPGQIVLDVGSVKVGPAAALAEVLGDAIPWVATHPLFGPLSLALAERPLRVVLCPAAAHPAAAARVRQLYERIGCEVVEQTPEGHDRVMAHTHALTFFVAKGMIDAGRGDGGALRPAELPGHRAHHRDRALGCGTPLRGHRAGQSRSPPRRASSSWQALSAIDRALDAQAAGRAGEATTTPRPTDGALRHPGSRRAIAGAEADARAHRRGRPRDRAAPRAARAARRSGPREAKAKLGAPVLDATREAEVMGARRAWADELKVDADAVADVFRAIMTMARRAQRG